MAPQEPVDVGVRGTMGSDLSIATALDISLFPSAFPPSAEATAGERRFARVTLGPKQMERTCCEHFTRDGPDSCNMPPPPPGSPALQRAHWIIQLMGSTRAIGAGSQHMPPWRLPCNDKGSAAGQRSELTSCLSSSSGA